MIEHLGTWAVGLAGIAGLIAISLRGGRKRRTKTADLVARRHRRYQAKGERVRGVLSHMQPLQNPAKCFTYLRQIPPLAFEELILSELKARGHAIKRSVRYSGDGGADGEWELNGRLWLVQAKRYASSVNPDHVRAFDELCRQRGARGIFVHTGRTGPKSRAAEDASRHIRIVSGSDLVRFVAGVEIALYVARPD